MLALALPALANGAAKASPITVFVAKQIITMDPAHPTADAVAVRDGKIVSVGTLDSLRPWLKSGPYVVDRTFIDKIIMPGFIEPHGHPLIGGIAQARPLLTYFPTPGAYGPAFPGVKTVAEAMAMLTKYVKGAKSRNETILAFGYDLVAMGGRHLDKSILDKVSMTQPILVWDSSSHFIYANSAALRKYDITRADTHINGIIADSDGEPNGQFLGASAVLHILPAALEAALQPEAARNSTRALIDLARQNGITTMSELGFGALNLPFEEVFFDRFFNDPATPMRVVAVAFGPAIKTAKGDGAVAFVQSLARRNTDKLMFKGVKFLADDAFLTFSMQVADPGYVDGHEGIWIIPPDKMVETFLPWWKAGLQIHVHSNGTGGNAATIDALAGLMSAHPRADHRFTLEHYGLSTSEMARRLKALGGAVSANPYYVYYRAELNAPALGTDRADGAAGFKTLIDAGVPVSMHADTPVGPPKPLEEAWIAVNRFGQSGVTHAPMERVSVDQAMRMITIDAAYTLGVEEKIGSIVPGKFADFVVLEQNPYEVSIENIKNIKIVGTILGGNIYHSSDITR